MNYECTIRSNYFRVRDRDEFEEMMSRICSDAVPETWSGDDGRVAFGLYGSIFGVWPKLDLDDERFAEALEGNGFDLSMHPDADDPVVQKAFLERYGYELSCGDYGTFLAYIQKMVEPGDAAVIFEGGSEGLRYVVGSVDVVTSDAMDSLDIQGAALKIARKMLGNQEWKTEMSY